MGPESLGTPTLASKKKQNTRLGMSLLGKPHDSAKDGHAKPLGDRLFRFLTSESAAARLSTHGTCGSLFSGDLESSPKCGYPNLVGFEGKPKQKDSCSGCMSKLQEFPV